MSADVINAYAYDNERSSPESSLVDRPSGACAQPRPALRPLKGDSAFNAEDAAVKQHPTVSFSFRLQLDSFANLEIPKGPAFGRFWQMTIP